MRKAVLLSFVVCGLLTSYARGDVEYSVFNLSAEWDVKFSQPEMVKTWYATSINNSGQIVGTAETVDNSVFAIAWDSANGLRNFPNMEGASWAGSINNFGQIALYGNSGAFLWDESSTSQQITGWGSGPLCLDDINDLGQVVGSHWPDNDEPSAFFWGGGIALEIGNLGGETSEALAINNLGQVVGWSGSASRADAFLWNSINGTVSIGTEFYSSIARDINDHGQIIGNAQFEEGGDWHTVIWEDNEIIDLDALIGESLSVTAINNSGQVIGSVTRLVDEKDEEDFQRYTNYAAIWDSVDGLQIIDELLIPGSGLRISTLTDINDNGWLIGSAFNNNLGYFQTVLLKPVPEPSWLVLIIGAMTLFSFNFLLSYYRKRRAL